MASFVRTCFIICTIAAVSMALVHLGCRALFWQLPRLEGTVNRFLADQGVQVQGIEGRWNGLNPGLYADRISFRAGEAHGVDFELDVVESLGRNRLVARRLTIADGSLAFDRTADGWRLRGSGGSPGFDIATLLVHSDQVWLRGRVALHEFRRRAAIDVEAMLINEDGNHRYHVAVHTDASCGACALTVDGDFAENGPGELRVRGESIIVDDDLIELAGLGALFPAASAEPDAVRQPGRQEQSALAGCREAHRHRPFGGLAAHGGRGRARPAHDDRRDCRPAWRVGAPGLKRIRLARRPALRPAL